MGSLVATVFEKTLAYPLLFLAGIILLVILTGKTIFGDNPRCDCINITQGVLDRTDTTEDLGGNIKRRDAHDRYAPFKYYGAMSVSKHEESEGENGPDSLKKMTFEGAGDWEGDQMPLT
ncbi:hypothetical protein BU16DRAFT_536177 [Lophium mytilinum]|uniref:Uncharacterized protein n=1 Tax=Lophium mytilinum TaxID=390894 RepID=A0A6A6R6B6_9PEZI|nr:hypothetical protein BU16DRAFT_536177 [Lophium mytilinum]